MDLCDSLDLSNTRLFLPPRVLLSAFGIDVQSRVILNWFIILGPNELRVWRHLITFKVQGNYSIVIYINHHFLGSLKSRTRQFQFLREVSKQISIEIIQRVD